MKRFFLLWSAVWLLISGCSPREVPERIETVANVKMGEIQTPRNGEGELFETAASLPGGFNRMQLEVVPFEHQVYRMILENDEVKADGDILECSAKVLEEHFNVKFTRRDDRTMVSELPGTSITLRRAFYLGVNAVAVEFVDRKLAEIADVYKKSDRYQQYKKEYAWRTELILLAQAVADFKLDTGKVPDKLEDLIAAPWNVAGWNGPYCRSLPEIPAVYKKLAGENYDLYVECNGKRIREDSRL